jgi:hypothetical protein
VEWDRFLACFATVKRALHYEFTFEGASTTPDINIVSFGLYATV